MNVKKTMVVVKGAGDLASGVACRLYRCGLDVIMTELERPLVVRSNVAFASAVYEDSVTIEGVTATRAATVEAAIGLLSKRVIPVLVDPAAEVVRRMRPTVVVDAIMAKRNLGTSIGDAPLVVGLGPGFTAGVDVHAVIETCRGHSLGRVIYSGSAIKDTGEPGAIDGQSWERLLRAPVDGIVLPAYAIGEQVDKGDVVAFVGNAPVQAETAGIVRGMIKEGTWVPQGTKIGDIDPRKDTEWNTISDKALAIGGGVLEAVFHFLANSRESEAPTACEDWRCRNGVARVCG